MEKIKQHKMKNGKMFVFVFLFQKYCKFWSISSGHFIKHKHHISIEWHRVSTENISNIALRDFNLVIAKTSLNFYWYFKTKQKKICLHQKPTICCNKNNKGFFMTCSHGIYIFKRCKNPSNRNCAMCKKVYLWQMRSKTV